MQRRDLKVGDQLKIGPVTITFEHKTGQRARVAITTDHGMPIEVRPCAAENLPNRPCKQLNPTSESDKHPIS